MQGGTILESSRHQKLKSSELNKDARAMLPVLVAVKDRVRACGPGLPYHREAELLAILDLADNLINAIIDDQDVPDRLAATWLSCIHLFIASTQWPEPIRTWEEA